MHVILIVTTASALEKSAKTATDRKIIAIGAEVVP